MVWLAQESKCRACSGILTFQLYAWCTCPQGRHAWHQTTSELEAQAAARPRSRQRVGTGHEVQRTTGHREVAGHH
jgi:hypothetical protein